MPDNIVSLPDALTTIGNRIDAAYERTKCGRQEWIEGSLELAAALLDGRERMGDVAFGRWLIDNNHDHIERHKREALMNLGRDPILMRELLENNDGSWRTIWDDNRTRYPTTGVRSSTANRAEPAITSNVRSTASGPWTNVIDARLIDLIRRGTSREAAAAILTTEFGTPFTKGMCIRAATRLGLAEPRLTVSAPPRTRSAPRLVSSTPAIATTPPRERNTTRINALTREQIDPEFTGTPMEFNDRHGHVSLLTAEQKATDYLTAITAEMRSAARAIQELEVPAQRRFLDYWLGWLRRPKARDIERLAEAIAILEPRLAEAKAWLARARQQATTTSG